MKESLIIIYLIFFVVALAFSLIINFLLLKFSKNLGIRNNNNADTITRWNTQGKPAMGGISFYLIFLITIISFTFYNPEEIDFLNVQIMGIFIAITIGFLLGLFDDAFNTKPWIKFFTQILCAFVLIYTNTYIDLFNNDFLNYFLTVFWVVGIMNSINMLDNMDGITTIVSIFILMTITSSLYLKGGLLNPLIILTIGSTATLIGFLFYNWNPSKLFMGNTGSQFLGVLLAGIGIIYLWNGTNIYGENILSMKIISVGMVFLLPLVDTTTVFIKRIARGTSPFVGGKDHTTHHLSYIGLTERQAAWLFAILSAISMAFTLLILNYIHDWGVKHIIWFGLYIVTVFLVLFIIANKKLEKKVDENNF